nr:hypothetical protein [Tanacetum cinerariifolium]
MTAIIFVGLMELIDYFEGLWEVILNGDSPIPTRVIDGVVQSVVPTTAKFGENKETKKVQKTLLKQQYENFTGSSSESLNQIHDRLQKLISQLEIIGEYLSQEDINLKFLRSLPTELRKKFEKAEQKRDELKLKLENFQTSSKNLSKLLASQITDKTGLGYDRQVFNSTVFDCDELISSDSDVSMPTSPVYDRYKLGDGYHAVPPPYTGTFMPLKPNLVFYDTPTVNETVPTVLHVEPSPTKPEMDLSQSNRPSAPIIEDWVSDSEDESEGEPMPTHEAPSFVQTYEHVKTPRPSVKPVEHLIPAKTLREDIPKSRGHRHSWHRKACFVCKSLTHLIKDCDYYEKQMIQKPGNPQHALKDKGVIDSGCSRHMTGNISYLSDFEEINEGYVAFGGNPKGGKITGKVGMEPVFTQQYMLLPLCSTSSKDPQNIEDDAAFADK